MNVTFRCPRCEQTVKSALSAGMTSLECPQCGASATVPDDAIGVGEAGSDAIPSPDPSLEGRGAGVAGMQLRRCLVCPSQDLFLRKDFPQRLGIAIVVVGFAGFLVANFYYMKYLAFGFLFATALIDVLLYFCVGEALVCYRCAAHYRGVEDLGDRTGFELETHERYRQMAARLGEAAREQQSPETSIGEPRA